MGTSAHFEVVVFDATTDTYLSKKVASTGFDGHVELFGLLPLESGDRKEWDIDSIEAWLLETDDASIAFRALVVIWLDGIKDPTRLAWPAGYTPIDPSPYGVITAS